MNKKKKKNKLIKIFFFFFVFFLIISYTFNYLLNKNINIDDKYLLKYFIKSSIPSSNIKIRNNDINVVKLLNLEYVKPYQEEVKKIKNVENNNYLVYIYNTHQKEEYKSKELININPTVTINNYIIKDIFKNNNINTLVEERSISDILDINNLNYAGSYIASRMYLEDVKQNNPSLKYFIDIHRDSIPYDKSTITIDSKVYAKVMFLIGLDNPKYNDNLNFTTKINDKVNEMYPGLSRGILQKQKPGNNGVYNQDFSPYTILIEIGGEENNIEEIMNTSLALSNILVEVIKENEK